MPEEPTSDNKSVMKDIDTSKKTNIKSRQSKDILINVLTSCLSGMLGALIIILIFREISPKPIIASVDVANIIRDQSKQIKNKDEAIKAAKTLSVNLQSTLEGLSSQFNMIILNKNAVYSGVPDYTLEVSQRLKSLSVD